MNIKQNLKEYIFDIVSVSILLGASIFTYLNVYYNPLIQYNDTIKVLSSKYFKEEILYNKQLQTKEKIIETKEDNFSTIPKLLNRINNTCKAPNVIIRTLKPHANNPFAFELKFISNYFDFLKVLSEFEKLNIIINKIDIKPYEIKKINSKHIITLDIQAINGGEKISKEDVLFLNEELSKNSKRDPFQRFAKVGQTIKRLVDLTWMYKLSGIGKIDGKYVATIDHRIYYKGSNFNGMKIINITPKGIRLKKKTSNGTVNYILGFRLKAKE